MFICWKPGLEKIRSSPVGQLPKNTSNFCRNRAHRFDHQWTIPRAFHVSPFNDRSGYYRASIKSPSHPPSTTTSSLPPRPVVRIHLHTGSPTGKGDIGPLKLTAVLRATVSTPLSSSSLLKALTHLPFALFLSFPRILYQASILHYTKRLDVFIRPEPFPGGDGVKWQEEGILERYARRRVENYLEGRVSEIGVRVELVSGNRAVPRQVFGDGEQKLVIEYIAARFFTILFQAPSAVHAFLLGRSERIFTVNSADLFLFVFSPSGSSPLATLSFAQKIRLHPLPSHLVQSHPTTSNSLPSPFLIPLKHPLDPTPFRQTMNVWVLLMFLLLENLEKWIFVLSKARIVDGNEPWEAWRRVGKVEGNGEGVKKVTGIGSVRRDWDTKDPAL